MTEKFQTASVIAVCAAQYLYEHGIALVVTDGKYVQIEKEKEAK